LEQTERLCSGVDFCSFRDSGYAMAPNETTDPDDLSAEADNVTDSMTPPRELATEFHKIMDKRERLREGRVKKSL
jgi:hypothetical protein